MPVKSVFMNRDGVVSKRLKHMIYINDFKLFEYTPLCLNTLGLQGYFLAILANERHGQLGYRPHNLRRKIEKLIKHKVCVAVDFATCYHENGDCDCKFPKPGLIDRLIREYKLDIDSAIMIANAKQEYLAAEAAGIKKIIGIKGAWLKDMDVIYKADSLQDATDFILNEGI